MAESQISPKIECTLQQVEEYIRKVRETGDLSWLTTIVGTVIKAQADEPSNSFIKENNYPSDE